MSKKPAESDLSAPIVGYWSRLGYTVRTEVRHCDLVAVRGEELIAVELKLGLGLKVLAQAAQRQQVADSVYVAVNRPRRGMRSGRWRGMLHLLRRLELGLIVVDLLCVPPQVEIVLHPQPYARSRKTKARRAMVTEVAQRSLDLNEAGTTGREIMTAYREHALRMVQLLAIHGPLTAAQLRRFTTSAKTWSTLYRNVYGWFQREGRGVYSLTPQGLAALGQHKELIEHWGQATEQELDASK